MTTPVPTPVLSVKDLSVRLPRGGDRSHAVAQVSFDVAPGKVVCLVGESGSGKSVIANAVMGLLPEGLAIDAGQILLAGTNIADAPQRQLRSLRGQTMAMVFQEPMTALNPVVRCGAQIEEMVAEHLSLPRAQRRQRVLETLRAVHLPDPERIFDAYPHQLSGGQRQRIVIAMALILQPALLICDEPTTALDVTTQAEILKLILELQTKNGTAVLFITHDFGVVADIADEVVVLQLGAVIEAGPKQAVLGQPTQPYTQMLLNAVPGLSPNARPARLEARALLEARKVTKTYVSGSWPGGKRVVHASSEISFTVREGQTLGIVGESGSGKSTVARCVARLIDPTSGDIFADGQSVATAKGRALSAFRRQVQVVFQDPYRSLNPRQTVGDSIIEGPLNHGVAHRQAWLEAERLMELVRLTPQALKRYPSEFSGGQRQRISIARALACKPKILIADEAVSALDVSVQAQIIELLNDIQARLDIGILFITHDLRVASQICDQVIVMSQGRVVESGPVGQVFFDPQHAYTRQLLDAAPGRDFHFARSANQPQTTP